MEKIMRIDWCEPNRRLTFYYTAPTQDNVPLFVGLILMRKRWHPTLSSPGPQALSYAQRRIRNSEKFFLNFPGISADSKFLLRIVAPKAGAVGTIERSYYAPRSSNRIIPPNREVHRLLPHPSSRTIKIDETNPPSAPGAPQRSIALPPVSAGAKQTHHFPKLLKSAHFLRAHHFLSHPPITQSDDSNPPGAPPRTMLQNSQNKPTRLSSAKPGEERKL